MPTLIVCVGYPASGKTTFTKTLVDANSKFVRISQDEIRKKGECEREYSKANKTNQCVLLDRCNLTCSERAYWLALAGKNASDVWAVWFDTPYEECHWRIARRMDHPTVAAGMGSTILNSLRGKLEPPAASEGFSRIVRITCTTEASALLQQLGCSQLSIETATQALPPAEVPCVYPTGCNYGITIADDYSICAHTRGHWVDKDYSRAAEAVLQWAARNSNMLFEHLVPKQHTLFGTSALGEGFIPELLFDSNTGEFTPWNS